MDNWRKRIEVCFSKCKDCTRRMLAQGLDNTEMAQQGPYINDQGPAMEQFDWLTSELVAL